MRQKVCALITNKNKKSCTSYCAHNIKIRVFGISRFEKRPVEDPRICVYINSPSLHVPTTDRLRARCSDAKKKHNYYYYYHETDARMKIRVKNAPGARSQQVVCRLTMKNASHKLNL